MFHHNQPYTIQIIIWISITIVALKIKTIHQKSYLMMGKMNFLTFQMDRSFDEIAFFFQVMLGIWGFVGNPNYP